MVKNTAPVNNKRGPGTQRTQSAVVNVNQRQSTSASGASQRGVRPASWNHPSSRAGDQDDVSYKQPPSNKNGDLGTHQHQSPAVPVSQRQSAYQVPFAAIRNLPSTRAGGQDDVSSQANSLKLIRLNASLVRFNSILIRLSCLRIHVIVTPGACRR